MKILITGANGQFGKEIQDLLKNNKACIGKISREYENANIMAVNSRELDITDLKKVLIYINDFKPDIIINCAAYTNVDNCETDREIAFKVNAFGPKYLAMAAERTFE